MKILTAILLLFISIFAYSQYSSHTYINSITCDRENPREKLFIGYWDKTDTTLITSIYAEIKDTVITTSNTTKTMKIVTLFYYDENLKRQDIITIEGYNAEILLK